MGDLTQAQVIAEAGELAGHTGLASRLQVHLPLLLSFIYGKYKFGFSWNLISGGIFENAGALQLVPGTNAYTVGAPSGSYLSTIQLSSIRGVRLWQQGESQATPLLVEHFGTARNPDDQAVIPGPGINPSGRPNRVRVGETSDGLVAPGTWLIIFDPTPDKAYFVDFMAQGRPATAYQSASRVPYFNDLTIIEGLIAYIYKHMRNEREFAAQQNFERMLKEDVAQRMSDLQLFKRVGLSPFTFRQRGRTARRNWMGD